MNYDEMMKEVAEKTIREIPDMNEYGLLVRGLAQVMAVNGNPVEGSHLSWAWHDPLSCIPLGTPFTTIRKAMESVAKRDLDRLRVDEQRCGAFTMYSKSRDAAQNLDILADQMLVAKLKESGIRKNTKKWKEAYSRNFDRFKDFAKDRAIAEATRVVKEIERSRVQATERSDSFKHWQRQIGGWQQTAKDLESIGGSAELVERCLSVSEQFRKKVEQHIADYDEPIQFLNDYIESLKQ